MKFSIFDIEYGILVQKMIDIVVVVFVIWNFSGRAFLVIVISDVYQLQTIIGYQSRRGVNGGYGSKCDRIVFMSIKDKFFKRKRVFEGIIMIQNVIDI